MPGAPFSGSRVLDFFFFSFGVWAGWLAGWT